MRLRAVALAALKRRRRGKEGHGRSGRVVGEGRVVPSSGEARRAIQSDIARHAPGKISRQPRERPRRRLSRRRGVFVSPSRERRVGAGRARPPPRAAREVVTIFGFSTPKRPSVWCLASFPRDVQFAGRGAARCRPVPASRARVLALRLARDKWCVSRVFSRAFRPLTRPNPTAASFPTHARRASTSRGRSRAALASPARRDRRDSTRFVPDPASDTAPSRAPNAEPCFARGVSTRLCGPRAVSRARAAVARGPGEERGGPERFLPAFAADAAGARRRLRAAVPRVGGEPRGLVAPPRARARVARARPHPHGRPGSRGVAAGVLERRASLPRNAPIPKRRAARSASSSPSARAPSRRGWAPRLRLCAAHVPADVHAGARPCTGSDGAPSSREEPRGRGRRARGGSRRSARTRKAPTALRRAAPPRTRACARARVPARAAAAARRTTRRTSAWCPGTRTIDHTRRIEPRFRAVASRTSPAYRRRRRSCSRRASPS